MSSSKRYALIVASQRYHDPKLRQLRAPAHDAEALAEVLADTAIGEFAVEICLDQPEAQVRRKLVGFFRDRGLDDLLLLHFSCHGVKDDDGNLYFATPDTELDALDATAVSAEFVERQIGRSRSRRIVLLLDCCYSGAFARGARARAGESVDLRERFEGRGRAVITASSAMEYAFEGDDVSGAGSPSVFTQTLVEGITSGSADRDADGVITVDELYDYVYEQVRERTPKQTPRKWSDVEGRLVIARNPNLILRVAELPSELRSALDSPFAGVREGAATELARLLDGADPGLAEAARLGLETLREDDSRRVSERAARALERRGPPEAPKPLPLTDRSPPDEEWPRRDRKPVRRMDAGYVWRLAGAAVVIGAAVQFIGLANSFHAIAYPVGGSGLLEPIMLPVTLFAAGAVMLLGSSSRSVTVGLALGLAVAGAAFGSRNYDLVFYYSHSADWALAIGGPLLALAGAAFCSVRAATPVAIQPFPRRAIAAAVAFGGAAVFVEPFNRPAVRDIGTFEIWAAEAIVPVVSGTILFGLAVVLWRWPPAATVAAAAVVGVAAPAALYFMVLLGGGEDIFTTRDLLGRILGLGGSVVAIGAALRIMRPWRSSTSPSLVLASSAAAAVLGAAITLYAFADRVVIALASLPADSAWLPGQEVWPYLDTVGVPTLVFLTVVAVASYPSMCDVAAGAVFGFASTAVTAYAAAATSRTNDHRVGLPLAGMLLTAIAAAVALGALLEHARSAVRTVEDARARVASVAARIGVGAVAGAALLRLGTDLHKDGLDALHVSFVVEPLTLAVGAAFIMLMGRRKQLWLPRAWYGALAALGLQGVLFFIPFIAEPFLIDPAARPRGASILGVCGAVLIAFAGIRLLAPTVGAGELVPQPVPAVSRSGRR